LRPPRETEDPVANRNWEEASLNRVLNHLEEWLIAFMMGAATIVIFVAVVHRYASGIPWTALQDALLRINLSWAQELCIYMFIWMAKFGAAYGVRTGIHVGVDVLINQLQPKMRAKFIIFGLLSGAVFTASSAHWGRSSCGKSRTRTRSRPTWNCRYGSPFWRFPAAPI